METEKREKFASRMGFILISAGCAIGLGNVYRFPIWCGAYGGGIFLLFYILFLIILGIPAMTAELSIGRASRKSIAHSFDVLEKPGQKWHLMKYLGVAGNYLLMMFYTTISGWFLIYVWKYLSGSIMQYGTNVGIDVFVNMISDFKLNLFVTIFVVALCFAVCAAGLQKGIERITKVMMVSLFILMFGLAIYSCTLPGVGEGLKFYFIPSISRAREYGLVNVITAAMSQAFFTLSLGIGSIGIFGSYIDKDRSLLGESCTIIALDTLVALMSGLIIFPAFFTYNAGSAGVTADQAGAVFLFSTFASIFNNMAAGRLVGTLFFIFMVFASFSTIIAVFESIMSYWMEWTDLSRKKIALINFAIVVIGTLPFIICNAGGTFLSKEIFIHRNFGDFEDFLVSNFALPFGSLVQILFCTSGFGWGWSNYFAEVNAGNGMKVPAFVKTYMKYVLPVIIAVILIMSLK